VAREDWKHLLRGGFAFEVANFACHPCDAERATEMFRLAKHEGADLQDVLRYARDYLREQGCCAAYVDEQATLVERFWHSQKRQRRKTKAWIVKWGTECVSIRTEASDIIAVFDSRKTIEYVSQFIINYYIACAATVEEKVHYASHAQEFPYRVQFDPRVGMIKLDIHDPLIVAFQARDVRPTEDERSLHWDVT
jgi:hypothetical protein